MNKSLFDIMEIKIPISMLKPPKLYLCPFFIVYSIRFQFCYSSRSVNSVLSSGVVFRTFIDFNGSNQALSRL